MPTAIFPIAMFVAITQPAPVTDESVLGGSEYTKLPETWELTYDIAMQPYVSDYKNCLEHTNLILDGRPNVEQQHRAALPRCAEVRAEAIAQSNAVLARRGRTDTMPPAKVTEAFDTLGNIHIQRGRNLDQQFELQIRATEERRRKYEEQIAERDAAIAREAEADAAAETTNSTPSQEPANVGY
ncbi:hypothetical protein [Erythrobacter sp. YT30]|uniref:hypothetical protein n=1 Tax=Erythrobacter sp. YT30 TaxID=1735012 RepID=UPI00076D8A7F|nr:hypothetical protein [Erythrobacter sp. YT30]KWV91449.1 hypothetical protein AUC45_09340 [Erythrobacter sp. YT30]